MGSYDNFFKVAKDLYVFCGQKVYPIIQLLGNLSTCKQHEILFHPSISEIVFILYDQKVYPIIQLLGNLSTCKQHEILFHPSISEIVFIFKQ